MLKMVNNRWMGSAHWEIWARCVQIGALNEWHNIDSSLACDNIVSATVVVAHGRILPVNEKENADLFWAIKGRNLIMMLACFLFY